MFNPFKKKEPKKAEGGEYVIIPIDYPTLNGGKSMYPIKSFTDFLNIILPNVALYLTDDFVIIQEMGEVIFTCQLDEELLKILTDYEGN